MDLRNYKRTHLVEFKYCCERKGRRIDGKSVLVCAKNFEIVTPEECMKCNIHGDENC